MQRAITGFTTDADGHWVAQLDCGHPQHVRHDPPFTNRPWVTTAEGRAGKLGQRLNCVRCDAFELPPSLVAYKRTDEFTEVSVPAALRRDHTTKSGVWARIIVLAGELRYRVPSLGVDRILSPDCGPGIVIPEVPHSVEPIGNVRFHVEFLKG